MNAVHDTLRTKAGDESLLPAMWSSYQAARSNVVGRAFTELLKAVSLM